MSRMYRVNIIIRICTIVNFCLFYNCLGKETTHFIIIRYRLLLIRCNNKRSAGGRGMTITDR